MKKIIFALPILIITTILLTSCASNPYTLTMHSLYESDTEVYYEVRLGHYDNEEGRTYLYNLAVFNKETKELSLIDDREVNDYINLTNYNTRTSSAQYLRSNSYEGGIDNPIFYNLNTNNFIDIRTNEIVELDERCNDTSYREYTCNILDNDIQIILNSNDDNTYDLEISNYITGVNLDTYNFTWDTYNNPYTTITSYNKYETNKVGIVVSFHTGDPYGYTSGDSIYKDSIVFEYDLTTNSISELFRGEEFRYFDFNIVDNHYLYWFRRKVSGHYNTFYKYNIEQDITSVVEDVNSGSYLGYGYWWGQNSDNDKTLYTTNSNYNHVYIDTYHPNYFELEMYSGNFMMEFIDGSDGMWSSYTTYNIVDLNTGEIIYEISKYNDDFVNLILEHHGANFN